MLRVGLTGGLGSGKSTAARMFAAHGAHILSSDQIARELMQPGQAVHAAIVAHFGDHVLAPDGTLDRVSLARIAFEDGLVEELNAIVHPAVLAAQQARTEEICSAIPSAIVVVESALIFETRHAGESGWQTRFDKIILLRASGEVKIARFVTRSQHTATPAETAVLKAEAHRRLAAQMDDDAKAAHADFVLHNDGTLEQLQAQVDTLWPILANAAQREG